MLYEIIEEDTGKIFSITDRYNEAVISASSRSRRTDSDVIIKDEDGKILAKYFKGEKMLKCTK